MSTGENDLANQIVSAIQLRIAYQKAIRREIENPPRWAKAADPAYWTANGLYSLGLIAAFLDIKPVSTCLLVAASGAFIVAFALMICCMVRTRRLSRMLRGEA